MKKIKFSFLLLAFWIPTRAQINIEKYYEDIFLKKNLTTIIQQNYLKDLSEKWILDEKYVYSTKQSKNTTGYIYQYLPQKILINIINHENLINNLKDTVFIEKLNTETSELHINNKSKVILEVHIISIPEQGICYDSIFNHFDENDLIKNSTETFNPPKLFISGDSTYNDITSSFTEFKYYENNLLMQGITTYFNSDGRSFKEKISYEYNNEFLPSRVITSTIDMLEQFKEIYKVEYIYRK